MAAPSGVSAGPPGPNGCAPDEGASPRGLGRAYRRAWRRHWPFLMLLAGGALLRLAVTTAYRPGLLLVGDSYDYLARARQLSPGPFHPLGYSLVLRLFPRDAPTVAVVLAQHALGLLLGVGTYLLLVRLGVRRWLAALAAAGVLLDGYELAVEQFLLAETVFAVLLAGGLALLLVGRLTLPRAAAAGLLLAAATLTRSVGGVVLPVAVALLVARRCGWRPTLTLTAAAVVPLLGYAAWFHAGYGSFRLTSYDGRMFYGKVAPLARCGAEIPADLRALCPTEPANARQTPTFYTWSRDSPFARFTSPPGTTPDAAALRWVIAVVGAQPGEYLRSAGGDFVHYFALPRTSRVQDWPVRTWQFAERTDPAGRNVLLAPARLRDIGTPPDVAALPPQSAHLPAAVLRAYQRVGAVPGPALAGCAVLAVLGAAVARPGCDRRAAGLVLAGAGLGLVAGAALTVTLDFRYLLPALVLLLPAGALGAEALLERAGGTW